MQNRLVTAAKKRYRQEMFFPSLLGILINPYYFSRKELARHLTELAPNITGKVLDAGCGNKPYASLYRAKQYIGLEIDTESSRLAGQADHFYDGHEFPFGDEVFDALVTNQVLEHVQNPEEFLGEISRVLKVGGLLLLSAPFIWDEHEQPNDYTRYSSFGIRDILIRHGFEVIEHRKTLDDIRVVFQLFNAYLSKTLHTDLMLVNIFMTLIFIAPVNIAGEIISWFTPRNADLYLDNIVLAKKVATD